MSFFYVAMSYYGISNFLGLKNLCSPYYFLFSFFFDTLSTICPGIELSLYIEMNLYREAFA